MDIDLTPDLPETTLEPKPDAPSVRFPFLPESWAMQKPHAKYDKDMLNRLLASRQAMASKKYNGHRAHILINDAGEVHLYNRASKKRLDAFVPLLMQQVRDLQLPANTLLDGEIYSPTPDGQEESLEALQSVISCGTAEEGRLQEVKTPLRIALFDQLVLGSVNHSGKPYSFRYDQLPHGPTIHRVELFTLESIEAGLEKARAHGWEGCVAWDMRATHKINARGNTKRWGAYKIKLKVEEDFIATGYTEGSGQGAGMVGTFHLAKLNDDGIFVPHGEVGSGLTPPEKLKYMDPSLYPFVVSVAHYGLDAQNRVTLAKIDKVHMDKRVDEVVIGD